MIEFKRIPKEGINRNPHTKNTHDIHLSDEHKDAISAQSPHSIDQNILETESSSSQRFIQAKNLYQKCLTLAEKLIASKTDLTYINVDEVFDIVRLLIDSLDSQELVSLVFHRDSYGVHYLSCNAVNVCVLSLEAGSRLGFDKERLKKIGIASFLHDVGMRAYLDIANQPKRLSISDYQKIKQHPNEAAILLKKMTSDLDSYIIETIQQEHERIDGSGYPDGLKVADINEFAQIIGFIDVYEALTHTRPYRPAFSCLDALGIIMKNKKMFNHKIIKAFLEKVGLYPKGTVVELNTKEKAYVLKHNPISPSCPTVRVVFDSQGRKLEQMKEIDLSRNQAVFIVKDAQSLGGA